MKQAPPRSRVSGLRAERLGDLILIDHTEFSLISKDGTKATFLVLIAIDACTNLLFAVGMESKSALDTKRALEELFMLWNVNPKAVCADSEFFAEIFMPFWKFKF